MQLYVRIDGGHPDTVRALRRWLADEPSVRRHGQLATLETATDGDMGIVIDVLTLVVGAGLSASQLVIAIAQWRQSLPSAPAVSIAQKSPDGTTLTIETSDPQALAELISALEEQ